MQSHVLCGHAEKEKRAHIKSLLEKIRPRYVHVFGKEEPLGIQDVHEIKRRAHLSPAGIQVFLLERSDEMTREASQALLKILEEPPEGSIFLLSAKALTLPETILSRVRVTHFRGDEDPDEDSDDITVFFNNEARQLKQELEHKIQEQGLVPHDVLHRLERCVSLSALRGVSRIPPKYLTESYTLTQ